MDFINRVGFYDLLDIIIVSFLIYPGLSWFKKTRAAFVLIGIFLMGVVYIGARHFGLFLTTSILQGFFAVLLLALVVIFQEELRHFFERLAVWGLGGRKKKQEVSPSIEEMVSAIANFVRERTGALLVVVGKDPVDRHLEGGHDLDGLISASLLESIFDPHSSGHDGALIIEKDRVKAFATRLPLPKNVQKIADYGTRHTAALGLSERCDALCIIVSEERGKVSIARDGSIREIGEIERLGPIVLRFMDEKFPQVRGGIWQRIVGKNWREKFISLGLAVTLWFLFAQPSDLLVKDFVVPVEFSNLPSEYILERVSPRKVTLTLSGDPRAFELVDKEALKVVVDVANPTEGRMKVDIDNKMLELPRKLKLNTVYPRFVQMDVVKKGPVKSIPPDEGNKDEGKK